MNQLNKQMSRCTVQKCKLVNFVCNRTVFLQESCVHHKKGCNHGCTEAYAEALGAKRVCGCLETMMP